ncbi:hypothetical protein GOV07_02020 [Candidatus Woesearchaeota archaeon]|nr:hypothetical protein [Candidatus Woesearchaeota archaeon]
MVPLINSQWNLQACQKELPKHLGVGYRNSAMVSRHAHVETYYSEEDMERETRYGYKMFSEHAGALAELSLKRVEEGFHISSSMYDKELSSCSDEELLTLMIEILRWSKVLMGLYHTTQPQCLELVRKEFVAFLEGKAGDPTQAFIDLTAPTTPSILKQQELDWAKIVEEKDETAVKKFYLKYRFLGTDEGFPPTSLEEHEKRFKEGKRTEVTGNDFTDIKKEQERLIKEYAIPENIQELAKTVQEFSHIRLEVRHGWVSFEWANRHVMEELGRRYGLTLRQIENHIKEEIIAMVKEGKRVPEEELARRDELFIGFLKDGEFGFKVGKEAKDFIKRNELEKELDMTELKGQIASKGYAKGRATVIKADRDTMAEIVKMKKGDILIATQTKPLFMPAIEKAAAIVTDEGGITGHAAIVSREFGVPCLIATQHATKIFKDGDLIEVDANTGIVRKL